jgi:uncharacterized oxidoreductase
MNTVGNTIFITGGSSGIGKALAHRWHDLGNTVIVAGRRCSALQETIEGRPSMAFYELDITDPDAIATVARRLIAEHPDLNVLVNCAGISGVEDPTIARDLSRAERMIETNLLGPIRMVDALVDHLKHRPAAAIVMVSSAPVSCRILAHRHIRQARRRCIPTQCRCAPFCEMCRR